MLRTILERLRQGNRTSAYPKTEPVLPERFRGLPAMDQAKCLQGCRRCEEACPTGAMAWDQDRLTMDLGKCLFCPDCVRACPSGAVTFTRDHRLATRRRQDLILGQAPLKLAEALDKRSLKVFGRALRLRQVSAGGCGACEADLNVLSTLVYDLGRFGVEFVASPRHADGLIITGPVSENMRQALLTCLEAVPEPCIVIASGACAVSGGPYISMPEGHDGADKLMAVDLFIPGCPPHPYTTLDGLLRLLNRL